MKKFNKAIGSLGENLAIDYLKQNKYKILDTNFKNRFGEIDIISKKDDLIIIIEVKGRFGVAYGFPSESVNRSKQKNIIKVTNSYLYINNLYKHNIRFDIIEIFLNHITNSYKINHIVDAFRIN